MIYIEEKSLDRQIELIEFLAKRSDLELVVWMYPEFRAASFLGLSLHDSQVNCHEPVTKYADGVFVACSDAIAIDKDFLEKLREAENELTESCDSFCLYPQGSFLWGASVIGHEGIILVRDALLLTEIQDSGFLASNDPPGWW